MSWGEGQWGHSPLATDLRRLPIWCPSLRSRLLHSCGLHVVTCAFIEVIRAAWEVLSLHHPLCFSWEAPFAPHVSFFLNRKSSDLDSFFKLGKEIGEKVECKFLLLSFWYWNKHYDSRSNECCSFQGCYKSPVLPEPTLYGCQCIYSFSWGRFLNHSSIPVRV